MRFIQTAADNSDRRSRWAQQPGKESYHRFLPLLWILSHMTEFLLTHHAMPLLQGYSIPWTCPHPSPHAANRKTCLMAVPPCPLRQSAVFTGLSAVYTGQSAVYTGLSAVYPGQSAVYTGQSSVYTGLVRISRIFCLANGDFQQRE
jgi:hypothetical protein